MCLCTCWSWTVARHCTRLHPGDYHQLLYGILCALANTNICQQRRCASAVNHRVMYGCTCAPKSAMGARLLPGVHAMNHQLWLMWGRQMAKTHAYHTMPCYAMLSHAMPCHAVLCHAVLCHAVLCHAVLSHAVLSHARSRYAVPYCASCLARSCKIEACIHSQSTSSLLFTLHTISLPLMPDADSLFLFLLFAHATCLPPQRNFMGHV